MSVTERQRHQLLAWYEEHMGPELAAIAMELTPPAAWGDLATKRDLDHLGTELHHKIDGKFGELHGEIGELRGEITGLHHKIDGEIGKLRAEMHELSSRTLRVVVGLMLATQSATVAIIAVLLR